MSLLPRALLGVALAACHSDPIVGDSPTPAGAHGKPIVELASGLAVANELVVKLDGGVDDEQARRFAAEHGARVVWRAPRTGYYVLRVRDRAAAVALATTLKADARVAAVLPHRVARGAGIGTSPDVLRAQQWNLRALSVDPTTPLPPIGGVRVAILDTGVAYEDHDDALGTYRVAPALSGVQFAAGYDFVNDDAHPNDDQGHGTHVAGVIAASSGIAPLAAGAEIIPVKVLDAGNLGTELSLAEGIYFAVDAGADVINMSLAFSPAFFPSSYLQRAITYAADHGVVMVAAVGNDGGPVVTYPAAFREVIAVGATRLGHSARRWTRGGGDQGGDGGGVVAPPLADQHPQRRVRSADYSNRGALVDIAAPGGDITRDADRDGNLDGIVAMSFVGDPTEFDYYLYAGTSQAAAEVSAIAARMLHENPGLQPDQVRAVFGETASSRGRAKLHSDIGLGHVVAPAAVSAAQQDQSDRDRPRYYASVAVTLHRRRGDRRYARAHVEIVDEAGKPARNVLVHGSFTGAAYAWRSGRTKKDGTVVFTSPSLGPDGTVSAFQVEAVVTKHGADVVVDRPRGFYRIDSCSLASLVDFAHATGIGTSPGPVPPNPILANPITVVMPVVASRQIDTLGLLNFSWGLATVPMSVAVDAEWFVAEFPGSTSLQVVVGGDGVGTSPIVIDPETSFSLPMPIAGADADCVDLHVRTFAGAGIGTSPIITDPNGGACGAQCQRVRGVLASLWNAYYDGVGTSPVSDGSIPDSLFDHLSTTVRGFVGFGVHSDAAPVGAYGDTLDAAGIGVAPAVTAGGASGHGVELMTE